MDDIVGGFGMMTRICGHDVQTGKNWSPRGNGCERGYQNFITCECVYEQNKGLHNLAR